MFDVTGMEVVVLIGAASFFLGKHARTQSPKAVADSHFHAHTPQTTNHIHTQANERYPNWRALWGVALGKWWRS